MSIGSWSIDANGGTICEADEYREETTIQWYSGNAVYLGIGVEPEVGKGIKLFSGNTVAMLRGVRARKEIKGICDTGESAAGGVDLE